MKKIRTLNAPAAPGLEVTKHRRQTTPPPLRLPLQVVRMRLLQMSAPAIAQAARSGGRRLPRRLNQRALLSAYARRQGPCPTTRPK